jgi:hypothetical protein
VFWTELSTAGVREDGVLPLAELRDYIVLHCSPFVELYDPTILLQSHREASP